jgi:hypothetical protein
LASCGRNRDRGAAAGWSYILGGLQPRRFAHHHASDRTIRIWDAGTGEPIGKPFYVEGVMAIAFDPTGERVLATSKQYVVIWSLAIPRLSATMSLLRPVEMAGVGRAGRVAHVTRYDFGKVPRSVGVDADLQAVAPATDDRFVDGRNCRHGSAAVVHGGIPSRAARCSAIRTQDQDLGASSPPPYRRSMPCRC